MNTIYDVVIVGAGPAGSSAAYHLAKQGINVLLLDKLDFPRDKACGDGLTPRALHGLDEMHLLDEVLRMGHCWDKVKLIAPAGNTAMIAPTQRNDRITYGLVLPRLLLDDLLRQQALACGAQFHSPVRVTDVLCDGNSVEVRGEYHRQSISYRASMVILAIGASTGLLLRIGVLTKMPRMALYARAYFEGVTDLIDYLLCYFDEAFALGYGWIFPLSDSCANIGAGFYSPKWQRRQTQGTARGAFDAFVQTPHLQRMLARAHQSSPVKEFPIRSDFATSPTFGERVMLVGEAAGLVHPLTGDGIAYALESGKLAAEHLCRMLSSGDFSRQSLQRYDRQLRARHQLIFSLCSSVLRMPFLYHPFTFTHGVNCFVQSLRLAFHIPIAKRLFFYALEAFPNTRSLSPAPLLKRGERGSETQKQVMLLGRTTADE